MSFSIIEQLMLRDLQKCIAEVNAYTSDEHLWSVPQGVLNSGGTLALHMAGNLQHFMCHILGGTDYLRDLEREFNVRNLTRAEVITEMEKAIIAVKHAFTQITGTDPNALFPDTLFGPDKTVAEILHMLLTHLSYHLGQLNYHRRITTIS